MEINITGVTALAMISGVLTPFISAVFTNPVMPPARKRLIVGGVAVVLGLISAIITGQLGWIPSNIVAWTNAFIITIGIVIAAAQGFYKQFKGTVETIEAAGAKTYVPEAEPDASVPEDEPEDDEIVVEEDSLPEGEGR